MKQENKNSKATLHIWNFRHLLSANVLHQGHFHTLERGLQVFHSSGCCNSIVNAQTTNVILGRNQHVQDETLFSNSLI